MLLRLQSKKKIESKSPVPKCSMMMDLNSLCKEEEEAKKYVETILALLEQNNFDKAVHLINNKQITKDVLLENKCIISNMKRFLNSEQLYIFTDNGLTTIRSEDVWVCGKGIYVGKGDSYSIDKTKFNVLPL